MVTRLVALALGALAVAAAGSSAAWAGLPNR